MVYKKRRHTHKTSINNSLNNSRSKKPRRIYRGGVVTSEEATAAAVALTGTPTPPTTTPTTPITPQSDADEIKRLRDECSAALEKTKKASRLARLAANAAKADKEAVSNALTDQQAVNNAQTSNAPQAINAANSVLSENDTNASTAANAANSAANEADLAANDAKEEFDKIPEPSHDIQDILIKIKQQLQKAETKKNEAIKQANTVINLLLQNITYIVIGDSRDIRYRGKDRKDKIISIKEPTIQQSDKQIFTKANKNIGYHASLYNLIGKYNQGESERGRLDALKTTNYRFRIYNWENPLVLPFYDDTKQTPIRVNNYYDMITTDRKTHELIVDPDLPNIEVHNRLLTIELKDTTGKPQKYKIGRRRVFTKLLGKNDEYSRRFYDEIIIRDDTGKQLIKQLKEANKHEREDAVKTPYIDFLFNIKDLSSFTSRDVKEWDGQQFLREYFETKKADNDGVNIYNQYSDLNAQSNTRLMDPDDIKKIIGYLNKILDELDNPAFKSMIELGYYRKFQGENGPGLIDDEIAKMRREFKDRRKYYRDELNLKRRGETFSASIKNVGSGSDPALSAKLDKLEKKVDQLQEEKKAGDARLDDHTGVMVYTMPPNSTIKRDAKPQQSLDQTVLNFIQRIKGSQFTTANKDIITLINKTSRLYESIEDEIIEANKIFLKMKGDPLGIDIKPVTASDGTIPIPDDSSNNGLKQMNPVNINIEGDPRDTLSRFLEDLDKIFNNLARYVAQIVAIKKDIIEKINTINTNFQSGGADINDLIEKKSAQERLKKIESGLSGDIDKSKIDDSTEPYNKLNNDDGLKTKIDDEYNNKIVEIKTKYDEFKTNIQYMTIIINHRITTPPRPSGGARKTRIRNRVRANTHSRKRHGIHKFKNRLYSGGAEPGESSTVDGNLASLQNKLDTENSPIPPPESNQEEESKEESKPDESEEPKEEEESKPDESEEPKEEEESKPDDEESKPDESEESKPDDEDKEDEDKEDDKDEDKEDDKDEDKEDESKSEDEDKEDESKSEDEDKEDDKDEDKEDDKDEDKEDESKSEDEDKEDDKDEDKEDDKDEDKEDESKPEDEAEEEQEESKPEDESKEDEESGEQELGEDEDKPEEEKESEEEKPEEAEDKESEVNVTGMGSAIESMQGDLEQIDKSIDETQDSLTKAIELINDGQKDVKQGDLEEGNKKIDDGSQMLERIARQLENSKDDLKKSITDMDSNLLQQLDNRLGNIEEILGKVKAGEQVSDDDGSNETNVKKSTQKDDDDDIADNCVKICSQEDQDDYLNDQMSMMNPAMMQQGMNNPMVMNPMAMNPMMQQGMNNPMAMNPMMQQGMNNPMAMNPMMQQGMMMNPMMQQGMAMNPMAMNPMMMNPMMMNPQFMYNNPYLYQNQPITNPMMENPRYNNMFNSTRSRQYRPPRDTKTRKNRDFTGVDKANDESPTIEESETE